MKGEREASKRISKAVREQAADACALMASSNDDQYAEGEAFYFGDAIDVSCEAARLAREAFWSNKKYIERETWAEAEALLRTGWTP